MNTVGPRRLAKPQQTPGCVPHPSRFVPLCPACPASQDFCPRRGATPRGLIDSWGDQSYFLVLHLFDPHMDYDPPAPTRGRFTASYESKFLLPISDLNGIRGNKYDIQEVDVHFIRAAYDEEIAFVDQEVGRFLDELDERGRFDDSMVVLTSDHGEELFEHGGFEHGHAMWTEVLQVPMIIWGPGVTPGREDEPVSLVDVAPTVLDWVGARKSVTFDGISLAANLAAGERLPRRTLFAEAVLYGQPRRSAIRWPTQMVVDEDETVSRVTVLADDEDTAGPSDPDVAARLLADLQGHGLAAASAPQDETPQLEGELLERLRSLGYVR